MIKWLVYLSLSLLMSGCSLFADDPVPVSAPLIIAHGASIDNSPYNSRSALQRALKSELIDGIEVDIVLTQDGVPVLAHDPWLDEKYCRRNDFEPIEYVLIRDLKFETLAFNYQCRYSLDGSGEYDSLVALSELIELLASTPNKALYLDLKIQEGFTSSITEYAANILTVIDSLSLTDGMKNTLIIEVPTTAAAKRFKLDFSESATVLVSYPAFYAGENWNWVGIKSAIKTYFFPSTAVKKVQNSGANGVMSLGVVMSTTAVNRLKKEGYQFGTFLIDDEKSFKEACASGADIMIVDYLHQDGCDAISLK